MRKARRLLLIPAVLAIAAASVLATSAQAAEKIDVLATVDALLPGPGGDLVVQLEWGVKNITTDTTLSVTLDGYIVYSNGLRQQVFPPEVHTLGPGDGVINLGFVIVPNQAAPGTATFHVSGRVHGGGVVIDADTFTVP